MKTEKQIRTNYENLKKRREKTYNLLMEDKEHTESEKIELNVLLSHLCELDYKISELEWVLS